MHGPGEAHTCVLQNQPVNLGTVVQQCATVGAFHNLLLRTVFGFPSGTRRVPVVDGAAITHESMRTAQPCPHAHLLVLLRGVGEGVVCMTHERLPTHIALL